MDIYEYAMQMEKDGENFYRELVTKTSNRGLKTILGMLADAEVKHYKLFENMKRHDTVHIADTPILADVKNIFTEIMRKTSDHPGALYAYGAAFHKMTEEDNRDLTDFITGNVRTAEKRGA